MKTIWIANYDENEIRIENTWFNGERLFVNGKLQDEKINVFTSDLVGHVKTNDGERKIIKVNLSGWLTLSCRLFVDDEKIEIKKIR